MLPQPWLADSGTESAPLHLQCLGALRLRDSAGDELTPRTRKARALLAVLAFGGRSFSRTRLADLLWSDRGEEQARSSVRQAIFELRHIDGEGELVRAPGHDEIALDTSRITTDLAEIRAAAGAGNDQRLSALLSVAEAGLFADLDGLDPEFDSWLRVERANEPALTFAAALEAAWRAFERGEPRSAQAIVVGVQRLDPASEEAARLAMSIDHALGDRSALHRHFDLFRKRLRDEHDASPSSETLELFQQLTRENPADQDSLQPGKDEIPPIGSDDPPAPVAGLGRLRLAVPALAIVALVGAASWKLRPPPVALEGQPPLIAVLPFEQSPAGDSFLAAGLWDDTRTALSHSGALRVLGPATARTMVGQGARPQAFKDRLGVSYLLDGRVRQNGSRVRVTVTLTRTADGIGLWQDSFEGRLGDPIALQNAVAQAIEGRLRGRLARGGGTHAEQIATTPEVYALYSKARALLRQRNPDQTTMALELLRRAVKLDPNFAPAWSSLASALMLSNQPPFGAELQAEAGAAARRALALAPNLGQAHAASALAAGVFSPAGERALERAVQLDPSDGEAWNWLGNALLAQYRFREARATYARAIEVDPLWQSALQNFAAASVRLGDEAAAERLADRTAKAGASPALVLSIRAETALAKGDYSGALAPLLALRRSRADSSLGPSAAAMEAGLARLGLYDTLGRRLRRGPWFGPLLRGDIVPPESIDGVRVDPADFWLDSFYSAIAARALVNRGRGSILVDRYRRAFRSREEFILATHANNTLVVVTPNVAAALSAAGDDLQSAALLAAAEKHVDLNWKNAPDDPELALDLARIRAAQGRRPEALSLLEFAVDRGWRPDGLLYALDIAEEPALASLRGDRRFETVRQRLLAHIGRERKELGPVHI